MRNIFQNTLLKSVTLGIALLPTTIIYFYGLALVLSAGIKIWVFLPAATFGYSLYSAWKLALKYENYKKSKIPRHVTYGIVLGVLSFLTFTFLIFSFEKILYKPIWQSIVALYVSGGGPAIFSCILITRATRMNHSHNSQST